MSEEMVDLLTAEAQLAFTEDRLSGGEEGAEVCAYPALMSFDGHEVEAGALVFWKAFVEG